MHNSLAMGLLNVIIAFLFSLYLVILGLKLTAILYPTLLLPPSSSHTLDPLWPRGDAAFTLKADICDARAACDTVWVDEQASQEKKSSKSVEMKTWKAALRKNDTLDVVFSLTREGQVVEKVKIPLVVFRKQKQKERRVRRRLVEGWPVLGGLYPPSEMAVVKTPAAFGGDPKSKQLVGYWTPWVEINLVADWTRWPKNESPHQVLMHLRLVDGDKYLPIVNSVQMDLKHSDLVQINDTDADEYPDLVLKIAPMSLSRFLFYAFLEECLVVHRQLGFVDDVDFDEIKQLFTGVTPEVLALTMFVSILHLLFDTLSFKSEIGYWREIKNVDGVSVSSLIGSLASQLIITLFLSEQNASIIVLIPSYFALLVGIWKLVKTIGIKKKREFGEAESSISVETQAEHTAIRIMSSVLAPIIIGYSFLTLVRDDHYSWYSWGIASLASCTYAMGFVLMTPQLFLNYKLKSVAHMNWSSLWYRAFNTFIDDWFAFLIPMPGFHRMAVFRDDIVFIAFLLQRYMYPARWDNNGGVLGEVDGKGKKTN